MPEERSNENNSEKLSTRRRILTTSGLALSIGAFSHTTTAASLQRKTTPEGHVKYGAQGPTHKSEVYLSHISDLPSVQRQLKRYEKTQDHNQLLTPELAKQLKQAKGDTIDLLINTSGERNSIQTKGQFNRWIHGWRPKEAEVEKLQNFGEVRFVPEFATTKIALGDVQISDIPKIAGLDFVLELNYDPGIAGINSDTTASTSWASKPSATNLKWYHNEFDEVTYDLTTLTQVGIFGTGYPDRTDWYRLWADYVGIDTDRAKDFIGSDWRTGKKHGTNCADTVAYFLKDGDPESNLIVPLKCHDGQNFTGTVSAFSNAIEYALKQDIPVGSCSIQTREQEATNCTSTLCEELDAYSSAGYMMTVATGNENETTKVVHPATSYFSIAVGGYSGSCTGGYSEEYWSNHGNIYYYDDNLNTTYCSWCHNAIGNQAFKPDIYACHRYRTDLGEEWEGTSAAAPIVAAGGAVHHSIYGATNYSTVRDKYHNMNNYEICSSDSATNGDVLHVPDLA